MIGEIAEGPEPGDPGEWGSPLCRCGSDATDYSPDGWPYCEKCGDPYPRAVTVDITAVEEMIA